MAPKLTTLWFFHSFTQKNWLADLEFNRKFCFLVLINNLKITHNLYAEGSYFYHEMIIDNVLKFLEYILHINTTVTD